MLNFDSQNIEQADDEDLRRHQGILDAGLPPVPGKLVKMIKQGEFIEMFDLLPARLSTGAVEDDGKPKRKPATEILDWVQCFSHFCGYCFTEATRKGP